MDDNIREQLRTTNNYFKQTLDLIPTNFYFDKETSQKASRNAAADAASSSNGKRSASEVSNLSEKAQLKRRRMDPAHIRTVTQIQQQLIDDEQGPSGADRQKDKAKDRHRSSSDYLDLKSKLAAKLEEMQTKRKAFGKDQKVERLRMKRREGKLKLKMRRQGDKQTVKGAANGPSTNSGKSPNKTKPIYNKEGRMVFSRFDFSQTDEKQSVPSGKNYKQLLEKVKRDKVKINKLKETDQSAGRTLEEKAQWKKVLQKAEGLKVKDNPELLKKALKKKEKKKLKVKRDWQDREDKVQKRMKERQDKRKTNIRKRKTDNKDTKIKKAKKKGRVIPGF